MYRTLTALLITSALACSAPAMAQADMPLARDLLERLIETNTAPSGGSDTRGAVALLEAALRDGGFGDDEITVVGLTEKLPNLVVRLRSPDPQAGAVLMMAHLDVVEGLASDWSVPPYEATEQDGYIYGRGATDNKAGAAILVANLIAMKREGFVPDRDLIVMLTADEETDGFAADFLATQRRDLIDADFALNTDGGLVIVGDDQQPRAFVIQTAEKVYVTYALSASDPGGHSSVPKTNSPISQLARALVALEDHHFPINLNETSRGFFANWSVVAPDEDRPLLEALAAAQNGTDGPEGIGDNPYYNSLARTTCVATQLSGGHAENALPQTARAVVNCRVLPQESTDDIEASIRAMVAPFGVNVELIFPANPSPPSPLRDDVLGPVTATAHRYWGDVPIIPELSTGATDGAFVRKVGIPVYGVGAIAEDPDDIRAHGMDERIGIDAFADALGFWYDLTRDVATID
ncbi:M20/M25/M40 family metallo-hydrolase [Alteraurantiacibacter aestuarii]|uniref:M20/M25/M40 family metallo-hydrolase n=1 Tax=Alteraurantiacibacter aestuarii TaxID=650004 RepID=A0A844ZR77_9SPHN|nr:M20/M25/M40 family metallo-hydrolase [Alteraurantiacibacter aestuarii]MXO88109.1 M20/M25/M40 family metallo-hydrolase [Alteraurantiacibacter aestuarii]